MVMWRVTCVVLAGLLCLAQPSLAATGSELDSASDALSEGALVMHTLNLTFTPAVIGWPTTSAGFAPLREAATTVLCGQLPSTVSNCTAFLSRVNASAIAAYVSIITFSLGTSSAVARTLQSWASDGDGVPTSALTQACAEVLGTALDTVTAQGGVYTVPCRDARVYDYLPLCAPDEADETTILIAEPTGDTKAYFEKLLCPATGSCAPVTITVTGPTPGEASTMVNLTHAGAALEAVLSYVADVRAAALLALRSSSPFGGNAAAGVGATRVELVADGRRVTLYAASEYTDSAREVILHCSPTTGMWALAIIAVVPFALILFRYLWYKGRHEAKKLERSAIIADEQRLMRGYTPGAEAMAGHENGYDAPPPGMDGQYRLNEEMQNGEYYAAMDPGQYASQQQQQWVMDERGNYYYDPNSGATWEEHAMSEEAAKSVSNTAAAAAEGGDGAPQAAAEENRGTRGEYM